MSITDHRKQHFCRIPFEKIEILAGGEVFLCCPGWLRKPIGNLNETPLLELWKNGVAQEIRQSMYDGTFQFCDDSLCPHLQALDTGAPPAIYSPIENREHPRSSYIETLISGIEGSVPNGPREIVVGFDLTCNLSCPSCRREPVVYRPGMAAWQQADKMAGELIGAYPMLRRLKIAGNGDPFASIPISLSRFTPTASSSRPIAGKSCKKAKPASTPSKSPSTLGQQKLMHSIDAVEVSKHFSSV
jgi:hypothetical protein